MIRIHKLRYRSLCIDSLNLEEGITSFIGANGSGKTTLLKLCAGIAMPESGTICIDGKEPRKTEVGWVNEFPDRNILFGTVDDEIASPLRFRGTPCDAIEPHVRESAESLGIAALRGRMMRELSGGEKVLVALAAAMVHKPHVLILDEYDSHLDEQHKEKIEHALRKSKIPYILRCTQDMDVAARGDYLIFLKDGNISHAGAPDTVFGFLTGTVFYPLLWRCRL
jgi:energy-coupling factor transport system ATP-binding protein